MKLRKRKAVAGLALMFAASACTMPDRMPAGENVAADQEEAIFSHQRIRFGDTLTWPMHESFPSQLLLPLMYTDRGLFYDTLLLD